MKKIETQKSLPDLVYTAVLNGILDGTLRSGQRVTQEGLAESLNVSRLPVGQALKRLEAEGFLCGAGRRGLKVSSLSEEFVRTLYEYRAGIDQLSAGLAARRAGPAARERGQRLIAAGRAAMAANDLPALIDADMEFHRFVYGLTENPFVLNAMALHVNHTRRIMRDILGEHRNQDQVWKEHSAILDAICAGDSARAELLARRHVENAADWLRGEISRAESALAGSEKRLNKRGIGNGT